MTLYQENKTGKQVKIIEVLQRYHVKEKYALIEYCATHERCIISLDHLYLYFSKFNSQLSTLEKLNLYASLFKGRQDVYAKSFINHLGKLQYYPSYEYGWKNLPVDKRITQPLTTQVLKAHLRGEISIGLFPITKDETCTLLVIDFDDKDWKEAVEILRQVAKFYHFQAHIEISRSGNGAHVWFFFDCEISCKLARDFGKKLLELAMQESTQISFSSFDRMFPNQDFLSKAGFGNLIALPLQGEDYAKGRRVFVDENFEPYPNQWEYLQHIIKIKKQDILQFAGRHIDTIYDKQLSVVLSNEIIVNKTLLSPKTIYYLKQKASFSNPEYYLKRAMRQPVYQTPERLYLFRETDEYLFLPRGLIDELKKEWNQINIQDERVCHTKLNVTFLGSLSLVQEIALSDLLKEDNGFLCASTGFGKTVVAAALIAERKSRTIILVHNKQLLGQWKERLAQFLHINEPVAIRYTHTGRAKEIGSIGQFNAHKKWLTQQIDIVMVQSLAKIENIKLFLSHYEMMIIDECHHVAAIEFERVVSLFSGRYMYGLTATPERKNGHEPILYQRIGNMLHKAEQDQVPFDKQLMLSFTAFGKMSEDYSKSHHFVYLNEQLAKDEQRNKQICDDIYQCYQSGRKILVLVNRREHITFLCQQLQNRGIEHIFTLSGQSRRKEQVAVLEKLKIYQSAFVFIATGKYIGEGFDLPKLDTLVLAAPLSWKNNLIQYAGRIHRVDVGKEKVVIFDYVDVHVPYLERMFQKRQTTYKKMGYQIQMNQEKSSLFDEQTYEASLHSDIIAARKKIIMMTNAISKKKILALLSLNQQVEYHIYIFAQHSLLTWIKHLESATIKINILETPYTMNLVVIDDILIWFGNMTFLNRVLADEGTTLLRIESQAIAKEFLDLLTC